MHFSACPWQSALMGGNRVETGLQWQPLATGNWKEIAAGVAWRLRWASLMSGNPGLSEDVATSNIACVDPEPIADSLRDVLKQAVLEYSGPVPRDEVEFRQAVFKVLDRGFAQASELGADVDMARIRASEMLADVLFRLKDIVGSRIHLHALLLILGKLPGSEESIGRELGVSKAAISKAKIIVQEWFAVPCRTGRTVESRAKFTCIKISQPRRQQPLWQGQQYFQQI